MSEKNPEISLETQVTAFQAEIARIKNELFSVDGTIKLVDVKALNEKHMGVWLRYKYLLKEMMVLLGRIKEENIDSHENSLAKLKENFKTLSALNDTIDDESRAPVNQFANWMRNRIPPLLLNCNFLLSKKPKPTGQDIEDIYQDIAGERQKFLTH